MVKKTGGKRMIIVAIAIYNLILLAGAAYLIQWHDWNPWWFLVAMVCCGTFKDKK